MKNNVYIGNRYVPIFANPVEWNDLRQYEPLTIVTYQGTAYTSRKTVPVGTALSNTEYWVVTGNYNAQVEEYRQEVVTLQGNVDSLATELRGDIGDINTALTQTNAQVALRERNVAGRKFLFVGDSYGDHAICNPSWVDFVVEYLGLTSSQYYNACVSASGFFAGTKFITQIQNYSGDKSEITDIVVAGGLNDSTFAGTAPADFTTLINSMQSFANYAKANYPNATLWLGYIGNALDDAPALQPLTGKRYTQRQWGIYVYNLYGTRYGFRYMSNVEKSLCLNTLLFGSDRVHPSTDGEKCIGGAIAQCLVGAGYQAFMPEANCGIILPSGRTKTGTENFTYKIDGDTTHIHYDGLIIYTCPDIASLSGANWVDLFEMQTVYFNKPVLYNCEIVFYTTTGLMGYQGQVKFDGKKVSVRVNEIDNSTHTYATVTLATTTSQRQIILTDIDVDVPTLYIN